MSPRLEFVLLSSLHACLLASLGYLSMFPDGEYGRWEENSQLALATIVAAAVSAALGAFWATALHSWARRAQMNWTPARLNLHAMLAALAIFPPAMGAGWAICEFASDTHVSAMTDVGYVLMIGILVGLIAIAVGALPAFILEYFACRRYLRRMAVNAGCT